MSADHNPLLFPADQEAPAPPHLPESGSLSWSDLSFSVPSRDQPILKPISGVAETGRLLAIMGPSGAGKSTMLNVLSGRVAGQGAVAGTVSYNGRQIDPVEFRSKIAYVMQEDALFATQTPREALQFSAALRLPSAISGAQRTELVDEMLHELGLNKCADTYVGSIMIRGVSGGEKKRTAIGVELVSQPKILFLDEPTSGLDSYAAYNVVRLLRRLAKYGVTVICTIHQPSSEVFALFDDTLLLADGRLVYHGAVSAMLPYFAEQHFDCAVNFNPADFVMFTMQEDLDWEKSRASGWAQKHPGSGDTASTQQHALELHQLWQQTQHGRMRQSVEHEPGVSPGNGRRKTEESRYMSKLNALTQSSGPTSSSCVQLVWLAQREAQRIVRDKASLTAQVGPGRGVPAEPERGSWW